MHKRTSESRCRVREARYRAEAEVIGRVTAVLMGIAEAHGQTCRDCVRT
jgi:hypothetical protein